MTLRLSACFGLVLLCQGALSAEILMREVDSSLVPSPVEYAVLAPDGYQQMKDLPLILNLHGGGGSRKSLLRQKPLWEGLWMSKLIPAVIVVTPSVTARGFYMNFKDGSERWEDFIIGEFIDHLRNTLPVSTDPKRTFVMGASMGGMGSLRMAFRHPDRFGAVAALEPGIEPVLAWRLRQPRRSKHPVCRSTLKQGMKINSGCMKALSFSIRFSGSRK
jgi:S-formylglutathione hydrolase